MYLHANSGEGGNEEVTYLHTCINPAGDHGNDRFRRQPNTNEIYISTNCFEPNGG